MQSPLDMRGERFGRLVGIEPTQERVRKMVVWSWACDCGLTCLRPATLVRDGRIKSCGCLIPLKSQQSEERREAEAPAPFQANKNNRSGLLGAYFRTDRKKKPWQAMAKIEGRLRHIGYFATDVEAHEAAVDAMAMNGAGRWKKRAGITVSVDTRTTSPTLSFPAMQGPAGSTATKGT